MTFISRIISLSHVIWNIFEYNEKREKWYMSKKCDLVTKFLFCILFYDGKYPIFNKHEKKNNPKEWSEIIDFSEEYK